MHKPWSSPSMTMPKNIRKKIRNISDAANASTTIPRNVLTPKTCQEEKISRFCDGHSTTNVKWWKLPEAEINLTLSGFLNKTKDRFFNQPRYIREILILSTELIKTIRHCKEIIELMFWASALRWRRLAQKISSIIYLWWPIFIINSIDPNFLPIPPTETGPQSFKPVIHSRNTRMSICF